MNRILPSWACPGRAWQLAGWLATALLVPGCSSNPNPDQPFVFPGTTTTELSNAGTTSLQGTLPATVPHGAVLTTSELRPGEFITVTFADLPPEHRIAPMEIRIGEDGRVTLLFSVTFAAAGKTAMQLQEEIRAAYVPKYFRQLTVTVTGAQLYYYVGGEVRNPGRQIHYGHMTVLRAIDTAGGFSEYAKKTEVKLTRSTGEEKTINAKRAVRNPELDVAVSPNDRIYVPRRSW